MTIAEAEKWIQPIERRVERDNDAMMLAYFSRSEDKYNGFVMGMDAGDALLVIEQLVKKFKLSPAAIAAMEVE